MTKEEGSDTRMGEYYHVGLTVLDGVVNDENEYKRKLGTAALGVAAVRIGLSNSIKNQEGISDALSSIAGQLDTQRGEINQLKDALSSIRRLYKKTEDLVSGSRTENMPTIEDWKQALSTAGIGISMSVLNPGAGMGCVARWRAW